MVQVVAAPDMEADNALTEARFNVIRSEQTLAKGFADIILNRLEVFGGFARVP